MELIWIIVMIVFAVISNAAKKNAKQKSETAKQQVEQSAARRTGAPAPARVNPAVAPQARPAGIQTRPAVAKSAAAPQVKAPAAPEDVAFEEAYEGSIKMPPREAHAHEGKELPCPADEREAKRPRSAAQASAAQPVPAAAPLTFNKNALVQAVVMSEILNRPRFENGRRVIR